MIKMRLIARCTNTGDFPFRHDSYFFSSPDREGLSGSPLLSSQKNHSLNAQHPIPIANSTPSRQDTDQQHPILPYISSHPTISHVEVGTDVCLCRRQTRQIEGRSLGCMYVESVDPIRAFSRDSRWEIYGGSEFVCVGGWTSG